MDYWGGAKGYVGPPSQIIGGAWPPLAPPLPTPMYSLFVHLKVELIIMTNKSYQQTRKGALWMPDSHNYKCDLLHYQIINSLSRGYEQ